MYYIADCIENEKQHISVDRLFWNPTDYIRQ